MPLVDWNVQHHDGHGLPAAFVGWLRRDRWFTDRAGAERSRSQYSMIDDDYAVETLMRNSPQWDRG